MPKTSDVDKASEQRRGQEADENRRMAMVARVVLVLTILSVLVMCVYFFLVSP